MCDVLFHVEQDKCWKESGAGMQRIKKAIAVCPRWPSQPISQSSLLELGDIGHFEE